jgi:formylglycine-generating enzyme required for sulfatase activity
MKKTLMAISAACLFFACGNGQKTKQPAADSTAVKTEVQSTQKESEDPSFENGVLTVNGVRYEFALVKGGTFTMGATPEMTDADDCEKPAHKVTLAYGYYMGKTEVTVGLWKAVTGKYPPGQEDETDLKKPVDNVSQEECESFIEDLNSLLGTQYFHLPTEAEWEFAARGGNNSKHYIYSGSNTLEDVAWNEEGNVVAHAYEVATKKPNELGIYDMSGNVWEWCIDGWEDYKSEPQTNPVGINAEHYGVLRGGNCTCADFYCRVSYRDKQHQTEKVLDRYSPLRGFRITIIENWDEPEEEEGL